jgi:hypothetical protein
MRGRGNFFSDLGRDIFKAGDFTKAADWMGGAVKKALSRGAGKLAEAVGFGDYEIKKNTLIDFLAGDNPNEMKRFSFGDGASVIRVQKREYLGPITAPASNPEDFSMLQYRLQPTNSTTFPWLCKIAQLYTEYELKGAIVSFETTSSNYSATVGLGTVAIATQYNANMLSYSDMDSILQSAFHSRGNPSENILHGIECDPALQSSEKLFTRRPGASGPPNLYDHGVFYVATEGLPSGSAGVTLGRLYITYDVELSLPELPIQPPWLRDIASSNMQSGTALEPPCGPTLTMTANHLSEMTFGSAAGSNVLLLNASSGPHIHPALNADDDNELFCWISTNSGDGTQMYISFARQGHYLVELLKGGTGGSVYESGDYTLANSNNCVVSGNQYIYQSGATDRAATWVWKVEVTQADGSVIMDRQKATVTDYGALRLSEMK